MKKHKIGISAIIFGIVLLSLANTASACMDEEMAGMSANASPMTAEIAEMTITGANSMMYSGYYVNFSGLISLIRDLLVIVVLALLAVWLFKQIQKDQTGKIRFKR